MISLVYEQEDLWAWQHVPDDPEDERPPYAALLVNLIWHTDLHLYSVTHTWIIAFIDDCSRRIMGWEFLPDKSSEATAAVLERVLGEVGEKPLALWSDNGTEFQGKFRDLLEREGMSPVYTEAYNPQQNGKIERFWPTVEACRDPSYMGPHIEEYNRSCCTAFPRNPEVTHCYSSLTPHEAYDKWEHWSWPAVFAAEAQAAENAAADHEAIFGPFLPDDWTDEELEFEPIIPEAAVAEDIGRAAGPEEGEHRLFGYWRTGWDMRIFSPPPVTPRGRPRT
jgi:hypothetical protein